MEATLNVKSASKGNKVLNGVNLGMNLDAFLEMLEIEFGKHK
jgi:hypothetical protein